MRAEFCIFESNAPGLKANFYEPYVDMPTGTAIECMRTRCLPHKTACFLLVFFAAPNDSAVHIEREHGQIAIDSIVVLSNCRREVIVLESSASDPGQGAWSWNNVTPANQRPNGRSSWVTRFPFLACDYVP